MAAITIYNDFGAPKQKSLSLFPLFPNLFAMKYPRAHPPPPGTCPAASSLEKTLAESLSQPPLLFRALETFSQRTFSFDLGRETFLVTERSSAGVGAQLLAALAFTYSRGDRGAQIGGCSEWPSKSGSPAGSIPGSVRRHLLLPSPAFPGGRGSRSGCPRGGKE